jgi:hypothetical protein
LLVFKPRKKRSRKRRSSGRESFGFAVEAIPVSIAQEGIPEVIPPEACYLGWLESLVLLEQLVEAEIPG